MKKLKDNCKTIFMASDRMRKKIKDYAETCVDYAEITPDYVET